MSVGVAVRDVARSPHDHRHRVDTGWRGVRVTTWWLPSAVLEGEPDAVPAVGEPGGRTKACVRAPRASASTADLAAPAGT
jgi:hypothetical protein